MIGQKLGSFLIEAELGSGAMGIVYRGVRETGKTRVAAVKVIGEEQIGKGKGFERFVREAQILEQFRHPNIVRYLARGKQGKTFYYAMEFVPGTTLDDVLQERVTLPWVEVVRIGVQVCDALQYAHDHGVVHRDLKPSNLMITRDNVVKLTDFGIAKDLDATALTATGRTLGTAAYMAPEQIRGTPEVSHKTDIYAFGILLYQMLTGELPFQGGSAVVLMHLHMNEPQKKASDKTAVIPVALDEAVYRMMAKAPGDRPWDAAAIGLTLRDLLDKHDSLQPIPMVWPEEGSASANPTRAMPIDATTAGTSVRKKKKKKRATAADRLVSTLPIVGLLAGLIAIGGVIGYLVWPPSAAYLYRKSKTLMDSADRVDWLGAESTYLDDLDRRFPDHPYRQETEEWRDKIALSSAERRAEVLENSAIGGFRKPEGRGETRYVVVFPEAAAARKRDDDLDAARRWREMAASLTENPNKADRGWALLAGDRAARIEAMIKSRADEIANAVHAAEAFDAAERPDLALKARRDILDRFSKYTDTAEALAPVRRLVPTKAAEPAADKPTEKADPAPTGSP